MDIFNQFLGSSNDICYHTKETENRKIPHYLWQEKREASQFVLTLIPTPVLQVQKCHKPLGGGLALWNPATCVC